MFITLCFCCDLKNNPHCLWLICFVIIRHLGFVGNNHCIRLPIVHCIETTLKIMSKTSAPFLDVLWVFVKNMTLHDGMTAWKRFQWASCWKQTVEWPSCDVTVNLQWGCTVHCPSIDDNKRCFLAYIQQPDQIAVYWLWQWHGLAVAGWLT